MYTRDALNRKIKYEYPLIPDDVISQPDMRSYSLFEMEVHALLHFRKRNVFRSMYTIPAAHCFSALNIPFWVICT